MKKNQIVKLVVLMGAGLGCMLAAFSKPMKTIPGKKPDQKVVGKMSEDIFGIGTEDYFTNPMKDFTQIGSRLEDEGFDALAIGGPRFIPIRPGARFPLAIMNVTDARDASLHLFDDYAIVTVMDLRSGKFYADMVVEQKYVKPVRDPASNPPPPGRSSDGAAADLFVRLGIPKVIGEYLVTGVLMNRISNRIAVKVGPPGLAGSDERFDQALSKHHEAGLKSDSTATNLIFNSGMEGPGSPVIIKESGIEISANPVSDLKQEKGPVMLEGSFRLAVGKKTPSLVSKGPAESDAFAITILATGSRLPQPLVYKFNIQFKHDPGGANSYILARSFSIDLNQLGWMEGGQTYSVYAFAGRAVSVPVNIQISKSILK